MIWLLIALWFFVGWGWALWVPHPMFKRHHGLSDTIEISICLLPLLLIMVVFAIISLTGYGRLIGHETPPADSDFK
jgi:hypothetical protein